MDGGARTAEAQTISRSITSAREARWEMMSPRTSSPSVMAAIAKFISVFDACRNNRRHENNGQEDDLQALWGIRSRLHPRPSRRFQRCRERLLGVLRVRGLRGSRREGWRGYKVGLQEEKHGVRRNLQIEIDETVQQQTADGDDGSGVKPLGEVRLFGREVLSRLPIEG